MDIEVPEGVKSFNLWTLWIMARLWEHFPIPQHFWISPAALDVHVTSNPRDAGNVIGPSGKEQAELFAQTLIWLLAEDFVAGKHNGLGAFAEVRLTTKGFTVLNLVPDALSAKSAADGKPLGTLIREAAIKESMEAGFALVRTMMTGAGHGAG